MAMQLVKWEPIHMAHGSEQRGTITTMPRSIPVSPKARPLRWHSISNPGNRRSSSVQERVKKLKAGAWVLGRSRGAGAASWGATLLSSAPHNFGIAPPPPAAYTAPPFVSLGNAEMWSAGCPARGAHASVEEKTNGLPPPLM